MNNTIKPKKYFLKDSELNSIEEDRLNQKDIVKNLNLIIDNTNPPYNIALVGKWGTGKSSIINLLLSQYKNNTENYNIEKINVWKENISIKNVLDSKFKKNSNNDVNIETNVIVENNSESLNGSTVQNSNEFKNTQKSNNKVSNILINICNFVIVFVASLFITSILYIVLEYFTNMSIYSRNKIFFVENMYVNYCENLLAILIFSIILTMVGLLLRKVGSKKNNKIGKNAYINKFETNYNPNYQTGIEDNKESNINKKNIIIVEDIDKLSATKMLAVLEEIKHCNEYKNCICIVSFDETVLKRAIEVRNSLKLNSNYRPVNIENVLDKIFQFKIYVPRICYKSVKEYAVNLVEENIPNFVAEYCPMDKFEKIIKYILIYKNVTTPRHAKKLINNFVNNRILISYRIQNGSINEELVKNKEFDFALAKISVIQSDFYDFYNILFKDYNYLNELTELYCLEPEELKEKYIYIDENLKHFLTSKYKPLRNFLKQTRRFEISDAETLLYLTKIEMDKMFGDKSVFSYIKADEDISELSINDILKLVQLIDKPEDLKEFMANNFEKILEIYNNNSEKLECFNIVNEIINIASEVIDENDYLKYLEKVATNYNYYTSEALEVFKNTKIEIPGSVMIILFEKLKENLSVENYDDTFKILKENSESFYEENGNVSEYVQFLVNYIELASNPNEVIEELDVNFTRIGRIYELNRNIKGLSNLDLDKAYAFMAKCLDNGDLDRMVFVINSILSDEDISATGISDNALINDCLSIEANMKNYNLVDVVEYNVDDMIKEQTEENYTLLKNLIEISAIKQNELNAIDVMHLIEKSLSNIKNMEYLYSVYSILRKFDRMYFYEIRRDFSEIIYTSFHTAKKNLIKEEALECAKYFKIIRLLKTKLTPAEEKFYNENYK